MKRTPATCWYDDAAVFARGLLMGGADVIPGVSGGTIALIVGIYRRLVTAISRFDRQLWTLLRNGRWACAARHVDARFLICLLAGIAVGVFSLGELMNLLLASQTTRGGTLSAFMGMILASSYLVARMASVNSRQQLMECLLYGVAGAIFAFWLTGLTSHEAEATLSYVFLCGLIAICAMILPGISGAYVLFILGMYTELTGILGSIRKMQATREELLMVAVFGCGCAIGIVSFSKFLRWLLTRFEAQTMALLCGFMLGSLRKIWPFHEPVVMADMEKIQQYRPVMPKSLDQQVLLYVFLACVAGMAVLLLDRLTRVSETAPFASESCREKNG